jgi:S1-C subfamily serine protease
VQLTLLDVVILVLAVGAAVGGYRLGFLARSGAWIGVLGGLVVATVVVEPAVAWVGATDPVVSLLVAVTSIIVLVFLGQAIGLLIGRRLRRSLPRHGPSRTVDRAGGAVAGVIGVLIAIWLLLPALGIVPGDVAAAARNSFVVGFVETAAPEPPQALRDLGRRIDDTDFPEVFVGMRPAPEMSPPPAQIPLDPAVVARVGRSTVNVEAVGCGGFQEGSGFVVAPGLVATNAHVVAGSEPGSVELLRNDGTRISATLVTFDPRRDLALLEAPGIDRPPLPLTDTAAGATGAVFGHPLGQDPLRVSPAQVGEVMQAVGRDIYGRSRVERRVAILSSDLERGDSGAALVTGPGEVSGVAFAIAPDRPQVAYALGTSELRAVLAVPRAGPVSSGPCI